MKKGVLREEKGESASNLWINLNPIYRSNTLGQREYAGFIKKPISEKCLSFSFL
jgi:hypothetical protein